MGWVVRHRALAKHLHGNETTRVGVLCVRAVPQHCVGAVPVLGTFLVENISWWGAHLHVLTFLRKVVEHDILKRAQLVVLCVPRPLPAGSESGALRIKQRKNGSMGNGGSGMGMSSGNVAVQKGAGSEEGQLNPAVPTADA